MKYQQQQHLSFVVAVAWLARFFLNFGGGFYSYIIWTSVAVNTSEAREVIKVILNNGKMPTINGDFCNEQDFNLIDAVISGNGRRRIVANQHASMENTSKDTVGDSNDTNDIQSRILNTYSRKCANYCQGYARGTCRVSGCVGYRRQRQLLQNEQRRLSVCPANVARVTTGLQNVKVSSLCKNILLNQTSITCFDEVEYAMIESFSLWNMETKSIIQESMPNNMTICIPTTATSTPRYTIEAIPNACVEEVRLLMTGPNKMDLLKIRDLGPYTIFGSTTDNYGDYDTMFSRRMSIGTYFLTSILPNSTYPNKKIQFYVKHC